MVVVLVFVFVFVILLLLLFLLLNPIFWCYSSAAPGLQKSRF